jgi:N-acetylmuramoyl-L-alanine amidase
MKKRLVFLLAVFCVLESDLCYANNRNDANIAKNKAVLENRMSFNKSKNSIQLGQKVIKINKTKKSDEGKTILEEISKLEEDNKKVEFIDMPEVPKDIKIEYDLDVVDSSSKDIANTEKKSQNILSDNGQSLVVASANIGDLEIQDTTGSGSGSLSYSNTIYSLDGIARTITNDELMWLRNVVAAEACNQPFEGQMAVAEVVLNRVLSPRFPNSIVSVIFSSGQFSPVADNTINWRYSSCSETQKNSINTAVDNALKGSRVVEGALFFRTRHYHDNTTPIKQIGDHYFSM